MARFLPFMAALSLLTLSVQTSIAQNINPKEFYDPNFPAIPSFNDPSNTNPKNIFEPQGATQPVPSSPKEEPKVITQEQSKIIPTGLKIETSTNRTFTASIEVAVNCLDQNHSTEVLGTVKRLASAKRARFATVYCLGAARESISQELKNEFLQHGIMIGPYNKVPTDLEVTQSPVWIFSTPSGKVVVEGIMNIERFLSVDGGFQGKTEQPLQVGSTPESKEQP
jgi:hypothetical protein